MNQTLQEISARKSVRLFAEKEVPTDVKEAVLHAALQAPTAGNQTLYTILDITQPVRKQTLAVLCDHQPFIATAPLVLIFVADCQRWYDAFTHAGCAPRAPREGDLMLAVSDANIAAQNAVVAAESLGLGSCYIGDVMEHCAEMRTLLHLPPHCFPAAMLVMGFPAESQKKRIKPVRFDKEYLVQENEYHTLTGAEHEAMWMQREAAQSRTQVEYHAFMQAFCARKYNSDFSKEMSRSVAQYLTNFAEKE